MGILNNLNPDLYKTTIKDPITGRYRQVMYSTLPDFAITAAANPVEGAIPIDSDKDLLIFAYALTIYGTISVPGGDIQIAARTVNVPAQAALDITPTPPIPPGQTDPVTLPRPASGGFETNRVSGVTAPYPLQVPSLPADAGAHGAPGGGGDPGNDNKGTLRLMFERAVNDQALLTLRARGGDGKPGQGGQDGSPGARGAAGHVQHYEGSEPATLFFPHVPEETVPVGAYSDNFNRPWTDPAWAQSGGTAGRGGDGGRGGNGGAGGELQYFLPAGRLSGVTLDNRGGDHGVDGHPGKAGTPSIGGTLTVTPVFPDYDPFNAPHFCFVDYRAARTGDVSQVQMAGGGMAADGKWTDRKSVGTNEDPWIGAPGEMTHEPVSAKLLGEEFDSTFFLKLLARGQNLFLTAAPAAKNTDPTKTPAYEIFDWITAVLSTLDVSDDPEYLRKKIIFEQANTLRLRCAHGRNVFGRAPSWVPRCSLDRYVKDMTTVAGPLQTMEATFLKMQADADQADLVDQHLSDALQTMEQQQQDYTAQINELTLELKDSVSSIDAVTAEYDDVRVKLGDVLAQYKLDVSTYRQGCSMDKMFKALEMVAFDTDNMAMVAVQGAELFESANALADGVDRDYVIQYMEQLQRETADGLGADLNAHLTTLVVQGADGKLSFKDDKTPLLLADLKDFEKEMTKFSNAFPDHGDALNAVTYNLQDAVRRRGDALLDYNSLLGQALQLSAKKALLAERQTSIREKLYRKADPTRAGAVSYIAALYQDMRNQASELVYNADRALAYWSAGMALPKRGFSSFQQQALWADGPAPSQFTAVDLLAAITDMNAEMRAQQEKFGSPQMRFPSDANVKSEMILSITDKAQLGAFRSQRKLSFSTLVQAPRGVEDKYDLRVWYARPRLRGVKVHDADTTVEINIVHLGRDTLHPQAGAPIIFTHDAVSSQFSYSPETPAGQKDYGMGGDGSFFQGKDDGYAPLGLLAAWQLQIDARANPGIDLSGLTEIEVEFGCLAYVKTNESPVTP